MDERSSDILGLRRARSGRREVVPSAAHRAGLHRAPLVSRMRRCGPDVRELLHDGYPLVCVQDAPFAYVNSFRAHVNVGFFHGASLPDSAGLLEGTGKYMRHVKLRPGLTLDALALEALIRAAYEDIGARLREANRANRFA